MGLDAMLDADHPRSGHSSPREREFSPPFEDSTSSSEGSSAYDEPLNARGRPPSGGHLSQPMTIRDKAMMANIDNMCFCANAYPPIRSSRSIIFESPYKTLVLIRDQLESFSRDKGVEMGLQRDASDLLSTLFNALSGKNQLGEHRGLTRQESIVQLGEVAFDELKSLFLPGELVFIDSATGLNGIKHERCLKISTCSTRLVRDCPTAAISGFEWRWIASKRRFSLESGATLIRHFRGKKSITIDDLGVVLLKYWTDFKGD